MKEKVQRSSLLLMTNRRWWKIVELLITILNLFQNKFSRNLLCAPIHKQSQINSIFYLSNRMTIFMSDSLLASELILIYVSHAILHLHILRYQCFQVTSMLSIHNTINYFIGCWNTPCNNHSKISYLLLTVLALALL